MSRARYFIIVIFCLGIATVYNNCANNKGVLDGSLSNGSSTGASLTDTTPAIDPPLIAPAYITSLRANARGATIVLSGPAQGLRYKYDATDPNWSELIGPFTSPYQLNFVWPEPSTTYTCFQTKGTDQVWRGVSNPTDPNDLQQCTVVMNYDIDSNGRLDSLTDATLIIRYLNGFTGDTLISGAVDLAGARTTALDIENFLSKLKNSGALDVDGNGLSDALTDGLLINRFMFGFTGSALITGAIDPTGTRATADAVLTFMQQYSF